MKNESLTLRHRIGLEIARKLNNDLLKEHPLKQLFWEPIPIRYLSLLQAANR